MKMLNTVLLAIVAASVAQAQLSPRQSLDRRSLADPRWQPGGSRVAVTVSEPPKGMGRQRHIWLADANAGSAKQFTSSAKSEWSPRWSPDGRTLAFLSDRVDRAQVWILSTDGGEATALTSGKARISAFEWSHDGTRIAVIAADVRDSLAERRMRDKDDARLVDHDELRSRIWTVDVATRKMTQVTRAPWDIREMHWTPDGTRLVVVATSTPESDQYTAHIYAVPAGGGEHALVASPTGPFGNVSVSRDGRQIAWIGVRVDGPAPQDIYVAPLGSAGAARNLTGATIDRPIRSLAWRGDGTMTALVEDGFTSRLMHITADGRATSLGATPVYPSAFDETVAGDVAFVGERTAQAPELWIWTHGQTPMQVTHVNDAWRGVAVVDAVPVHWTAPDGLDIDGRMLVPPTRQANQRLPLVVLVHGGPAGAWSDAFEPWGQLLASRGYAVLYPNPRGSTGYGQRFLEANRGDWGGGDYRDIMAGVDAMTANGIADSTRLGIGGWSYGGYMSEWAITQTTRFKAAIAGAGLSDLAAEFGTEDGPAYDEWYYGLPYEQPAGFARSSPLTYISRARTPTLILQGEEDVVDPIGQSTALYRALKRYKVPAELVLYPREGHGLSEEKHLIDRLNRVVEWYARWMK
jgi:dipeptidyl aminopeptidase/acylaminoacyl peptidase